MFDEVQNGGGADAADRVLPFQLDRANLRGRVVRLGPALDQILTQHRYPPSVSALLAETTLLTAMIGQAMKLRGSFSIQAQGDGPIAMLTADYYPPRAPGGPAALRAYAQFDRDETPERAADPYALVGSGLLAMTIDQGANTEPYQGLTPLTGGGLADSAATYFAQSEQVATRFAVAAAQSAAPGGEMIWRGGGVMLQHLGSPGAGARAPDAPSGEDGLMTAQDVADMNDHSDAWRRANLLLDTVEELELIGPRITPEQLLIRLFHEEQPRIYDSQPVGFGCSCDRAQILEILRCYPAENVDDIISDSGDVTADCQFCGAHYRYAPEEITGG